MRIDRLARARVACVAVVAAFLAGFGFSFATADDGTGLVHYPALEIDVPAEVASMLDRAGLDGLPPCTDGKVRVMTIGDCWGARLHVRQADYEAWKQRIKGRVITLVECEDQCDIGHRYWHRTECQGMVGAWFYLLGWECVEPSKVAASDRLPWIPATPCPDDDSMVYERICRCFDQLGPCPPGSPGF